MTEQDYEKIKGEIADGYIKKFKDELGWFKSLTVLPIEWKLKKLMISDTDLEGKTLKDLDDLGRRRNILGTITPSISNDIFDFLKEKQSLIVQAETAKKLDALKNEVVLGKIVEDAADETTTDETTKDKTTDETTTDETKTDETTSWDTETTDKEEDKTWSRNSKTNGLIVWITWAGAYKSIENTVNKYNDLKLKKELNFEVSSASAKEELSSLSKKMDKMSSYVDDASKNTKLSRAVRKNLSNSSKKFAEVAEGMWDEWVITAWEARWKIGKDMPAELLNNIDPKTAEKFANLSDDVLEQIAKADTDEAVIAILKKSNIENVGKDVIGVLKNMDDLANIKAFSKVLKFGKKLSPVLKWLSCIWAIDLLFFWFDVWMWNESMNEADFVAKINESRASVKRDKATFELYMGAASIVLEAWIILICSSVWTTAWSVVPWVGNAVGFVVGLVVGVVVYAIQELVNTLYYDKLEFYTQNREDYIRQERTEVKQAILQCAKEQEVDANPNLTDTALNEKWINTFQDAWEAIIFQEEMDKYQKGTLPAEVKIPLINAWYNGWTSKTDYIATLSADDKIKRDEEREIMDKRIASRMEYVKTFITKENSTEQYEEFMEKIKASAGLAYIEKIVWESDVQVEINDVKNEYLPWFVWTVDEYKIALWTDIQKTYPEEYTLFENLYTSDINKFEYLCTGINGYTLADESVYTETELVAIKKNKEFVKKFYHYKNLWLTIENTNNVTIDYTDYDYNYLERVLIDMDQMDTVSNFNDQDVMRYFSKTSGIEAKLKTDYQVSSSTGQNILYRMAREFHWYTGNNDMFSLMWFYSEYHNDVKGIYYDDEWMVNDNGYADSGWELDAIDKENMSVIQVYANFGNVFMLDSKVEVADNESILEFRKEMKKIIEEEIAAKAPEKKEEVETKIVDFVKAQSKAIWESASVAENGALEYTWATKQWYVEIPYNLVIAAKKAKIGDIEKFLFKYENDKVVAVSSKQYVDISLDFDSADIDYEKVTPLRSVLTEEEKSVIDKVDAVKKKLDALRAVASSREDNIFGWHEDELDIPVEIEREMTKKVYERENVKESLLYLDIADAKGKLSENWNSYYQYFNGTYMGMLATISQFTMNNNLWSFTRMSQARAWTSKEKYTIDDAWVLSFDHLELEDDEKEYIVEYTKKSYQGETKTVEELLKSTDETEKQKGEWMLDQIMIWVFESETLFINPITGNIKEIYQEKDSYDTDVEKRITDNFTKNTYVDVITTLANIDDTTITKETQEIKKVSKVEKGTYEWINETLSTIIDTMNNVDRWYGRREIKFVVDEKESTDDIIVGAIESRWSEREVKIDVKNEEYSIEGLDHTFSNVKDFAYTTNFMNRVEWYYIEENPEMKGQFFFWDFLYPNTLFADRSWDPNDVDILNSDTVISKFSRLQDGKDNNREMFLKILNNMS